MKRLTIKCLAVLVCCLMSVGVWGANYIPQVTLNVTKDTTIFSTGITGEEVPESSWVVLPQVDISSKSYKNTNGDEKGNPTSITDNMASADKVNMPKLAKNANKYNEAKKVIHMRINGITGIIVHGVTGSSGRGIAIGYNEATESLTENTTPIEAVNVIRSGSSGSFICQYLEFDAKKTYIISIYAAGGDSYFYAAELIAPAAPASPSIKSFTVGSVEAVINQAAKTITAELPYSTEGWPTLTPTVVLGGTAKSYTPTGAQDFSSPVTYTATDGTNNTEYTVTLTRATLGTGCDITSFVLAETTGVITGTDIAVNVPAGTDISHIAPTITTSIGATVSPASGEAQNFQNGPVVYTVTSEDKVNTKNYTVTVKQEAYKTIIVWNGAEGGDVYGIKNVTIPANITTSTNSGVAIDGGSLNVDHVAGNYWLFEMTQSFDSIRLYGKIEDATLQYNYDGSETYSEMASTNQSGNALYWFVPKAKANKFKLVAAGTGGYWFRNMTIYYGVNSSNALKINKIENVWYANGMVQNSQHLALQVYNVNGKLMATGTENIDMHSFPAGIYIVRSTEGAMKIVK